MVIVVAEGPTAAGKTTWCLRFFPHATVAESSPDREFEESPAPRERHAVWLDGSCRRWHQALAIEQLTGLAVCDTDPFKLHYIWSLWRLGKVGKDEWELAVEANRAAFAEQRLGIADLMLVYIPPLEELRRRRERDRAETGRLRGRFELHHQLGPSLHEWYEAIDRLENGRVRWKLPEDGALEPLLLPRDPRSGVQVFDALLAELPD
jgi:hypothetical protein